MFHHWGACESPDGRRPRPPEKLNWLLERDHYYHATVKLAIDRISPLGGAFRPGLLFPAKSGSAGLQEIISGRDAHFDQRDL